jgi:hypothetical protein
VTFRPGKTLSQFMSNAPMTGGERSRHDYE